MSRGFVANFENAAGLCFAQWRPKFWRNGLEYRHGCGWRERAAAAGRAGRAVPNLLATLVWLPVPAGYGCDDGQNLKRGGGIPFIATDELATDGIDRAKSLDARWARHEVMQTVSGPPEVDEELRQARALFARAGRQETF